MPDPAFPLMLMLCFKINNDFLTKRTSNAPEKFKRMDYGIRTPFQSGNDRLCCINILSKFELSQSLSLPQFNNSAGNSVYYYEELDIVYIHVYTFHRR